MRLWFSSSCWHRPSRLHLFHVFSRHECRWQLFSLFLCYVEISTMSRAFRLSACSHSRLSQGPQGRLRCKMLRTWFLQASTCTQIASDRFQMRLWFSSSCWHRPSRLHIFHAFSRHERRWQLILLFLCCVEISTMSGALRLSACSNSRLSQGPQGRLRLRG